jgi:hypothetical protein
MLHALESQGTPIARLRWFKTSNVVPRREQAEEVKGLGADDDMGCVHPSTRRWSGGVCLEQQSGRWCRAWRTAEDQQSLEEGRGGEAIT